MASTHPLDIEITPKMREVMQLLDRKGIRYDLKSVYQIKVGRINFYPKKGTITIDALPSIEERGVDVFLKLAMASKDGLDPRTMVTVVGNEDPHAAGKPVIFIDSVP